MKAVILAAGEGIRMRPLTQISPKPMLEVCGKPILHHIFDALPDEIDEVILVVGYLGGQIKEHFGSQFGKIKITYVTQSEKLGTAHALGLCREILGKERFLMLYADDIHSRKNLEKCLRHPLSLLVKKAENPERFGVVLADENDFVLDFVEKPERPISNLVSTGPGVLDGRIFDYPLKRHSSGEKYLTDALAQMAKDHPVKVVRTDFWIPIGYPEDLKKAEAVLREISFL